MSEIIFIIVIMINSYLILAGILKRTYSQIIYWWMMGYFFTILIPITYQYYFKPLYFGISETTLLVSSLGLLSILVSYYIHKNMFKYKKYNHIYCETTNIEGRQHIMFLYLMVILIMFYIMFKSPTKPLVMAIQNIDYRTLILARESNRISILPVPYVEFWIRQVLNPIFTAYFYLEFKKYRNFKDCCIFIFSFVLSFFFGSFNLVKSPSVVVVIVVFFSEILTSKDKKVIKKMIRLVILVITSYFIIMYLQESNRSIVTLLEGLLRRIILIPSAILNTYIQIYQDTKLLGRSINFLSLFYDKGIFHISNYIFRILDPNSISTGTAPSPFLGEMYANFGLVGSIVSSFLLGAFISFSEYLFNLLPKNNFNVALYSFLFYAFFETNRTNFTTVLMSYGVFVVLFLAILCNLKTVFSKNKKDIN